MTTKSLSLAVLAAALALTACSPAAEPAAEAAAPAATTPASVTPAEVKAMIEADGAPATVSALYQNGTDPRINSVFQGIESGDQAWLDVAAALQPGVDGENGYSFNYALSMALTRNPAGTLRLVSGAIPVTDVCTFAQIEPTETEKTAWYAAATTAVNGVTDPGLASTRAACLAQLAKGE